MIHTIISVIAALFVGTLIYRIGYGRAARHLEVIWRQAIDELVATTIETNEMIAEQHQQDTLLRSTHVALLMDVLDQHVEESAQPLNIECRAVVETIKPYYETQTLH